MARWKRRPEGSTWGDFGPDDQLGRLNLITPEKVKEGVAEVKEGKTFCLSLPLELPGGNVLNPRRHPPRRYTTLRNGLANYNYPFRRENPDWVDVVSDDAVLLHTQYSTQWDSFAHVGQEFDADGDGVPELVYYNGFRAGTDVVARAVMQKAGDLLGQPVVVENRTGAAGNLGAEAAAKSAPDGYTVVILSTIHAANQSFFRKLGYSMENDFAPVIEIGVSPTLWVVRADLPVKSVPELAAYARANPGKLTFGSGGASHPVELFKALTGGDITLVLYRGVSAAMQDLLAGRVDMSVAGYLDTGAHIKAGKLRALAVLSQKRSPLLPDVPTFVEHGMPDFVAAPWFAIVAPAATPRPEIGRAHV